MVVRIVQEEEFHGRKDQGVVDQGVVAWVQGAGVEQHGERRIGSKVDERWVPVVGMSCAEVAADHGTQEEGHTVQVQVQVAMGTASYFVVVEGGEY